MAISTDILGVMKEWYTDKPVGDLFWRNSPLLKMIQKNMIGGKTYNVPLILGNGGAAAGDATVAQTISAANGAGNNQQFAVTYGQLFSIFTVLNQDILASRALRGAFVPVPVLRMYQGLDSFRKLAATALYGTGFGEIGQAAPTGYGITPTAITQGTTNTITVPTSYTYKMSVGSQIVYTNGATPGSTLRNVTNTITKIGTPGGSAQFPTTVITVTTSAGTTFTPNATDWIEFNGCRTGSTALLPVGLPGWLPYVRTGLGTSFFGVDRSINEISAGNFIQLETAINEKRVDAVTRAVAACRSAGGVPDYLVSSVQDWAFMALELQAQTNYWQAINNGGSKTSKNEVAKGLNDMSFAFASNWVQQVVDDPMCPYGYAWIVEKDTIEFAGLTNSDTPLSDGVQGTEPGAQNVDSISSPDLTFKYIADNYMTVQPGAVTVNGPAVQVILQMFGNYVVHEPSHCAVIKFLP